MTRHQRSAMRPLLLALAAGLVAACSKPASPATAVNDSTPWRKPGDKIDSIFPMEEYLRRFRIGLDTPTALAGGADSREAVARDFLAAVQQQDTSAIRDLLLSRAEFAWLIFPDHKYAAPPYELDPAIFWGQMASENAKGVGRLFRRFGGKTLTFQSLECTRDTLQMRRGPATLWGPCITRYRADDSTVTLRIFGTIVERDGRFKLLSAANDL